MAVFGRTVSLSCVVLSVSLLSLSMISYVHAHGGGHGNQQPPTPDHKNTAEQHKKAHNFTDINKEHIQHHLKDFGMDEDATKMDDKKLEFYHFKLHDANNDLKIDGLEMFRVMMDEEMDVVGVGGIDDKEVAEMVDHYLKEVDIDHDGYIDYAEYKANSDFFIT